MGLSTKAATRRREREREREREEAGIAPCGRTDGRGRRESPLLLTSFSLPSPRSVFPRSVSSSYERRASELLFAFAAPISISARQFLALSLGSSTFLLHCGGVLSITKRQAERSPICFSSCGLPSGSQAHQSNMWMREQAETTRHGSAIPIKDLFPPCFAIRDNSRRPRSSASGPTFSPIFNPTENYQFQFISLPDRLAMEEERAHLAGGASKDEVDYSRAHARTRGRAKAELPNGLPSL